MTLAITPFDPLKIFPIPAFQDNYLWLIHDTQHAVVVDPGSAPPVLSALATLAANDTEHTEPLKLVAILLTHHHADHVGGVGALLEAVGGALPVFGPRHEPIATISHPCSGDDGVFIPELGLLLQVHDVPGHTKGHIAYVVQDEAKKRHWLFCGDTLFAGGCGRLFEGTPEEMFASLEKLSALPSDTQVYCTHEYTLSNLRFALVVEPDNAALIQRFANEKMKRDQGKPTLPTSIGLERATNPFLRCTQPSIIRQLHAHGRLPSGTPGKPTTPPDPVTVFAALRQWKNTFV